VGAVIDILKPIGVGEVGAVSSRGAANFAAGLVFGTYSEIRSNTEIPKTGERAGK
jgi:hypothetical protein